jgi:hypothetical protein
MEIVIGMVYRMAMGMGTTMGTTMETAMVMWMALGIECWLRTVGGTVVERMGTAVVDLA